MDLPGRERKYLKSSFSLELFGRYVYCSGDQFFSFWETISPSPTIFLVNTTMNQGRNKPAVSLFNVFLLLLVSLKAGSKENEEMKFFFQNRQTPLKTREANYS